jgi:hypothetical protein
MNTAIAEEGLRGDYGAAIGKLLWRDGEASLKDRARAYATAGSDARMSGCELPVCILSGSGNQGMTASLPVIVYARELGVDEDTLLRALIVSDLITVHQKTGIGTLSAYCGAISAGCGCGAGICYLHGGRFYEIAHTVVNAVAILSGTICDGAKPSCAAKIAMAVEAGIMGFEMIRAGRQFLGGDGIVQKGIEKTLALVPAEKVINGVPFYTRLWMETTDESGKTVLDAVSYSMEAALQMVETLGLTMEWDEEVCQYVAEGDVNGVHYSIWLEEERSMAAKMKLVRDNKLSGIAAWSLGMEKKEIWDVLIE